MPRPVHMMKNGRMPKLCDPYHPYLWIVVHALVWYGVVSLVLVLNPKPTLWTTTIEGRSDSYQHSNERRESKDINTTTYEPPLDNNDGDSVSFPDPSGGNSTKRRNFIDVDDMKDEKVDLSFETIVPSTTNKKKRRRVISIQLVCYT